MAQTSTAPQAFLVRYKHPIYYQRTGTVQAATLDDAITLAQQAVADTRWTVVSVTPYTA